MALDRVKSAVGSLPPTHVMERLSTAYITAVAASAGCSCSAPEGGQDYGTDFDLEAVEETEDGTTILRPGIKLQSKATVNAILEEGSIRYRIKGRAYNKIVRANQKRRPTALVLYRMPKDQNSWIVHDEDHLRLYHNAYWAFLDGEPVDSSSTVIRIPLAQSLSKESIPDMFEIAEQIMFG